MENERELQSGAGLRSVNGMTGSPGTVGTATTHLGPPSLTRTNVLGDVSHVSLLPFARVREDFVFRPLVAVAVLLTRIAGESVGPRFES